MKYIASKLSINSGAQSEEKYHSLSKALGKSSPIIELIIMNPSENSIKLRPSRFGTPKTTKDADGSETEEWLNKLNGNLHNLMNEVSNK